MNIDPVKEQFSNDGIGILVSGINVQNLELQCPIRHRSIIESQYADIEILKVPGVLQVQNGVRPALIVYFQLLDTGIVLPHCLIF